MKTIVSITTAAAILAGASLASVHAQTKAHVISAVKDAQWGPAPPMLPPGAQIAVLAGNPMGNGAYTVRLKFPANYIIPAHSHPTDENVVVVSGAVTFGMGNDFVRGAPGTTTLKPGGFALMPAGMNHYAYTTDETTVVLYGQGPVEFKYVHAKDDPRPPTN